MKSEKKVKIPRIGMFTLVMITSALFMTLRNMPMMGQTGLKMLAFNIVAAFAFLIPVALVSAELATAWAHHGGIYSWVKQAFGRHLGFLAVWLQWGQSMFGMTSILAYVAATLAYLISPAWASNRFFIFTIIVTVYWIATFANMHGNRLSGVISTVCVIAGVFFPALILFCLGGLYLISGQTVHLDCTMTLDNWIPSASHAGSLVMLLSFIFGYVGVEVSASHANEVRNARRSYPLAIFLSAIIGFIVTLVGGLIVAMVLPKETIEHNLINGIMLTFSRLFKLYGIASLMPLIAILVALGATGQVSTWIVGPVKGLLATANRGDFPPTFRKLNKKGIPAHLLIFQAIILTIVSLAILLIPSVNLSFLLLTNLAVLLYTIAYILMFVAAIRLRYTKPDVVRPYKIPGGKCGIWLVAGLGVLTSSACFFIGFIPPDGISKKEVVLVELFMGIGLILMVIVPFIIMRFKPASWNKGKITEDQRAVKPKKNSNKTNNV
jgi:glutamate:GABA antiporter